MIQRPAPRVSSWLWQDHLIVVKLRLLGFYKIREQQFKGIENDIKKKSKLISDSLNGPERKSKDKFRNESRKRKFHVLFQKPFNDPTQLVFYVFVFVLHKTRNITFIFEKHKNTTKNLKSLYLISTKNKITSSILYKNE